MDEIKPNHELAYEDYAAGMKYKDIAGKYGVTLNTVKSWKTRYGWRKNNKKGVHTKTKKVCTQNNINAEQKEVIADEVTQVIENPDLTDKQRLFCLYYIKSFNATQAYRRVYECSEYTAQVNGSRMLNNTKVKKEIECLKQGRLNKAMLEPEDIFEKYMQIAFADMGAQADINGGMVKVRPEFDGTIVSEISETPNGIKIKLNDRMKALQWITDHMGLATEEQKARIAQMKAQTDKLASEAGGSKEEKVTIINNV